MCDARSIRFVAGVGSNVLITTTEEQELVLLRIGDAIKEIGSTRGLQAHPSAAHTFRCLKKPAFTARPTHITSIGFDTCGGMRQFDNMVEWITKDGLAPYPETISQMETHINAMINGEQSEQIWLLEHPPLYTAGTSSHVKDLTDPDRFPVYATKRGGQYTYHGPGQRVAYAMLDLNTRGRDVRKFVWALEEWVIKTLAEFNITGERRDGRVGVWVVRTDKPLTALGRPPEDKIAAVGVRLRKWHSFHGICFNVEPDLSHYEGIVPCGIAEHGVTSLVDLGLPVTMEDLDVALKKAFNQVFSQN